MKKINRRTFIKAAAILTGGTFFAGCNDNLREVAKNLDIKYLRQIITVDSSKSRCIMWQSDSKLNAPAVEINGAKIPAVDSTFTDDGQEIFQYTAQIENLSPATEYQFKIVDGENFSKTFTFKTSYDKNFKAIIFSDSQSADYKTWGEVARAAFQKNPDAEFFVDLGDIVDNGEDRLQWQSWFTEIETPLKKLAFVPVLGNHECYNRDWKVRFPAAYINYFAVPDNGTKDFSRRFYSFDYGAAHFVILDSQWDELEQFAPNLIETQKKWLREDVAKTSKKWKIALIHKDVLQYRINGRPERAEGFSDVGVEFMPEFENLGFDVVFSAHLHTYRNRGRLKNFVDDDGGTLYILTGLSGDVRYPNLWINHALDKVIAPQPETDNFLTLEVDEKILSVKCFLPSGELIDEISLSKV